MSRVRTALAEHLDAVAAGSGPRIGSGYADDATLVTPEETVRGRDAIVAWFVDRAAFFGGLELRIERLDIDAGGVALTWHAVLDGRRLAGYDRFDIDDDGLIVEQRVVRVGRVDHDAVGIRVEREPPLAWLVIDRDEKRNAVSQPMLAALTAAVDDLAGDEEVRAVVLRGEGRDFCAGEDVGGFALSSRAEAEAFLEGPFGFFTALERLPKPVIVAVHGHTLGFGSEVLIVADTVVASPDARFGFAEIDHRAVPSVLVTRGLDVVGRRRALRFALTGERFGVDDAVAARLVHLVAVDPVARAGEVAAEQAGWSPASIGVIKDLLGREAVDDHDRAREFMPAVMLQLEAAR